MRLNSNELSNAVRFALAFGVVSTAGAVATTAYAQTAKNGDKADSLETITVVGSRIKRTDVETSQPVFVLERADLQKTGLSSIGDILQNLTTNGATLNTTFNNGGNGETRVDLRNIGSNRTLVLVNGHRWVAGIDGAVDLNTIPVSIIERVEILKDGASAVYGSDAIGGVVNITTRSKYDGAEASAYYGENSHGDGETQAYDFTVGASTERASVVMNVSYVKQDPIFAGDRDISAVPTFGLPPNNVTAGASSSTRFGRFGRSGVPGTVTLIDGHSGTSASDYRPFSSATDGFNFAPENYLSTPQERTSLFTQGRYNITDNIAFKTEVLFNQRRSEQYLAPTPLTLSASGLFASPVNRATVVTVSAANAYNPFGVPVTRAQLRMPEEHPRQFDQDVDTWRFGGGLEGTFELAGRSFSWDTNFTYSQNEENDTTAGLLNLSNVANAVGPTFVGSDSRLHCGTDAAHAINGCVPLNLFDGSAGVTQEMYDYISFIAHDEARQRLTNYTANLTGDLFELPAGPLGFAAGYEYRRENGFSQPDALTVSGVSSGNAAPGVGGGFSLDEFYAEFNIPLLKDVAFAQTLELTAAVRYSDYNTFGNTTNSKFGFRWKPIDDLLVRGNYSKGFRAPSVAELFTGASDSYLFVADPCDANNLAASLGLGTLSPHAVDLVTARCRAAGVPDTYEQSNFQIRTTTGGNIDLQPENAKTTTLGLVYSPSYVQGLDLYLDWYKLKIDHAIAARGPGVIVDGCYLDNDPADCALLSRGSDGSLVDIEALTRNQGALKIEGYDFTASYKFDTADFGKFQVSWDSTYTSKYKSQTNPGADFDSLVGNYYDRAPYWRLKSNIDLNWQYGDFGATLGAKYFSALDEDCNTPALVGYYIGQPELENLCSKPNEPALDFTDAAVRKIENTLSDRWYFDLQGRWDAPWNARVTAGVRNLFDRDPPLAFSTFANTFDPQYPVPGRFWYMQYNQKF